MKRSQIVAAVFAVMGAAVVGVGVFTYPRKTSAPAPQAVAAQTEVAADAPLAELSRAVAKGDGMALAVLKSRVETRPADIEKLPAMTEAEASEWVGVLANLRAGLSRFSGYGRATAVVVASGILQKFADSPAPPNWMEALKPSADLLSAAASDKTWEVRVAALSEIKSLWRWNPRRDFLPVEREALISWKQAFHGVIVARLKDSEVGSRTAAVACLGLLPNDEAEPAIRCLDDVDPGVRIQVLLSFADRVNLLTEEAILPLLYDPSEFVSPVAERVLKNRGLSPEQLGLSKLVVHPRAEMRLSAFPFLKDRTDVDPVIWLRYLSRDRDEAVRMKALEELAQITTPEARQRISEMAAADTSAVIRERARKLQPAGTDTTADALPPLPSSSNASFKLKAN